MTDRTTLRAIMDAMKPGPSRIEEVQAVLADFHGAWVQERHINIEAYGVLEDLKPSNTKAQLLEGIAEARQILEGKQ